MLNMLGWRSRRLAVLLAWGCMAAAAHAANLDVPYVPTPQEVVDRMLEMAKVGPQDYLIDLGSGDGRIVVTAAKKFGARGFGVDLNPARIKESVDNANAAGVTDRVAFHQRNLFETDLSDATVITMYLLPRVNLDLRPRLLDLKPGTRIVSHDFDMDDWKADTAVNMDVKAKYGDAPGTSTIYYWIVPAKAAGNWQWQLMFGGKPVQYELSLDQRFQVVTGTARVAGRTLKLQDIKLRGDQISVAFTADVNGSPVKHELSGRVIGNSIEGTAVYSGARAQGQSEWTATRGVKTGSPARPSSLALIGR